jgi:hypothetical protein
LETVLFDGETGCVVFETVELAMAVPDGVYGTTVWFEFIAVESIGSTVALPV